MSIIFVGTKDFPENLNTFIVEPENNSISVAKVRELIRFLSFSAPTKTVVIKEAHNLTEEAQNALLKTLEEPPENAEIILVTRNEDLLLETIRSRCQIVYGPKVDSKLSAHAREILTSLPDLSPAEKLVLGKKYSDKRDSSRELIDNLLIAANPMTEKSKNIRALFRAKKLLEANCSSRLVMENLFLNW